MKIEVCFDVHVEVTLIESLLFVWLSKNICLHPTLSVEKMCSALSIFQVG